MIDIQLFNKSIYWFDLLNQLDPQLNEKILDNTDKYNGMKILVIQSSKYSCRFFLYGDGLTIDKIGIME